MIATGRSPFTLGNVLQLARGRVPGQVIIQVTDACNARCPQCEMRVDNRYRRSHLAEDEIRRTLRAAAERGVAAVSFTGGEPFLHFEKLLELLNYASDLGIPFLRTGTNGYFLRRPQAPDFDDRVARMAERLAETRVRNVWLSIDSADPQVHERMCGFPGLMKGIERAVPIFREHGIWVTANLGVNRNTGGEPLRLAEDAGEDERELFAHQCREAIRSFYRRVLDMGFTIVNFCYPMSVESEPKTGLEAVYRASSADDVVRFRREEKVILFQAMSDVVGELRHRIRIFTPRSMLRSLVHSYRTGEEHGYACRGGLDFFFVSSADGDAYPCGFRADESLGKYWQLDPASTGGEASCTRCDWECFRDPSNLVGPLLELPRRPWSLLKRLRGDREWTRLWLEDLRYQRACHYFDGRRAPDLDRLAGFAPRAEKAAPAYRTGDAPA